MAGASQPPRLDPLATMLDQAVRARAFPAAQAAVVHRGALVHASAHGADHEGRPTSLESVFDVASVTKAAATTLAAALLIGRGALRLEERACRLVPRFSGGGRETVTIRELLAHASGLPAWLPLFALAGKDGQARSIFPGQGGAARDFERSRAIVVEACIATALTPARGQRVYSDLGFIVLGMALEAAARAPLDRLCRDEVFGPLGLSQGTGFADLRGPGPSWLAGCHVLPTGLTRPREPAPGQEALYAVPAQEPAALPGEVDDDNAYALGGVAGHAGLFSTSSDLATLGWRVAEELAGADRLGAGSALRDFARHDEATRGPARGLGFDLPAREGSLVGERLGRGGPRGAIGHFGFTGCSLWVDLDRDLSVSLLTNRTFPPPGRSNVDKLRAFRPAFHDAVVLALEPG